MIKNNEDGSQQLPVLPAEINPSGLVYVVRRKVDGECFQVAGMHWGKQQLMLVPKEYVMGTLPVPDLVNAWFDEVDFVGMVFAPWNVQEEATNIITPPNFRHD